MVEIFQNSKRCLVVLTILVTTVPHGFPIGNGTTGGMNYNNYDYQNGNHDFHNYHNSHHDYEDGDDLFGHVETNLTHHDNEAEIYHHYNNYGFSHHGEQHHNDSNVGTLPKGGSSTFDLDPFKIICIGLFILLGL